MYVSLFESVEGMAKSLLPIIELHIVLWRIIISVKGHLDTLRLE